MHGVVLSHGYVEGNKPTALYLVELLVRRSGYTLVEQDEKIVDMLVDVARGDLGSDELAHWFRDRLTRKADVESRREAD